VTLALRYFYARAHRVIDQIAAPKREIRRGSANGATAKIIIGARIQQPGYAPRAVVPYESKNIFAHHCGLQKSFIPYKK